MLIVILQKDSNKYVRWGMFDAHKKALEFALYIQKNIRSSFIPSFIVVVATSDGITEYNLTDYIAMYAA